MVGYQAASCVCSLGRRFILARHESVLDKNDRLLRFDFDLCFFLAVFQKRLACLFADDGFDFAYPDISEANRVAVVLDRDRAFGSVLGVFWRTIVGRVPFQFEVVLDQDSVVNRGDVGR